MTSWLEGAAVASAWLAAIAVSAAVLAARLLHVPTAAAVCVTSLGLLMVRRAVVAAEDILVGGTWTPCFKTLRSSLLPTMVNACTSRMLMSALS